MAFSRNVSIENNTKLRAPQREGWSRVRAHFLAEGAAREVGVVLPVGCGKSGLIALTPFALDTKRALVIAPGLRIRKQLADDLKSNSRSNFYERFGVLTDADTLPETVVVEGGRFNLDDLLHCDIAVANIHQIAGDENRWLDSVGSDFFDLLLVDEAHHNLATSWQQVKARFPAARIVNFSATPTRADGRRMDGMVVYSFPVVRAIQAGYVKRLRAKMLSPTTLRYSEHVGGQERDVGPDEVRRLGETDAGFRRGIVMGAETLGSIVDCSINELVKMRRDAGEPRLKIIASALNQTHCVQIRDAFRHRGMRAEYVHSLEDGPANERIFTKLANHELDVIVQARMLGEGFDHPYLAVAMVGSIFANLAPFVQFVGRVMRAIEQNAPDHPLNQGVVVFHVGANVARRWSDFRTFSEADQAFFADLLPQAEEVDFAGQQVMEHEPGFGGSVVPVEIIREEGVRATELDPIGDPATAAHVAALADSGLSPDAVAELVRRVRTSRQDERQARRSSLSDLVPLRVGEIFGRLGIKREGKLLDRSRRLSNFRWAAAELNRRVNAAAGGPSGDRQSFTLDQLEAALVALPAIAAALEEELRHVAK